MAHLPVLVSLLVSVTLIQAQPVREGLFVEIGGIRQWVTIEGDRATAPVLLFLHGGPGNPPVGEALKTLRSLRGKFVLVIWHQRESGRTLAADPSPQPLTPELFLSDADEISAWLLSRFQTKRIFVMGHSWGGYLALRLAAQRPERIAACLVVSPMIHQQESERMTLDTLRSWAVRERPEAVAELSRIRLPLADGAALYLHRKWIAVFSSATPAAEHFVLDWSRRWLDLFREASSFDFRKSQPELDCPVYFLIGGRDLQTHFRLAEDYFRMLNAPEKEWIGFPRSGHSPHRSEPRRFLEEVGRVAERWPVN